MARSLGQEGPWRRAWQLTPVILPGESHGQKSLAGYSPEDCKKTRLKQLSTHAHMNTSTAATDFDGGARKRGKSKR